MPADDSESPEWRQYEQAVASLLARLDFGAVVEHHVRVRGVLSGYMREIDVRVTGSVVGYPVVVAVECKHRRQPVGVDVIEGFASKLDDIAADFGVLVSSSGFTEPARLWAARAQRPRVELRHESFARSVFSVTEFSNRVGDHRRVHRLTDLTTAGNRPGFRFSFRGHRPPEGRSWRYREERLAEFEKEGRILWRSTGVLGP